MSDLEIPELAPDGSGDEALPLTTGQRGVFFAQRLAPANPAFNTWVLMEIRGRVDGALLRWAIRRAEGESGTFDVEFVERSDGPVQRPVAPGCSTWRELDLSGESDPFAAAHRLVEQDRARPLDLFKDALSAHVLMKVGEEHYLWYQRSHHVLTDAFGSVLHSRRISLIYEALEAGEEPAGEPLGRLTELLADDADYRASPQYAADRDYWTRTVADRPDTVSLAPGVPGEASSLPALRSTVRLPAETLAALSRAGREARAPWTVSLMTAVAAYLHGMTGATDLTLGVPVTARLSRTAQNVPGMLSNTLPLRLTLDPARGRTELIRHTAARLSELLTHQRYPYDDLRRELRLPGGDEQLYGVLVNIMPTGSETAFTRHEASVHALSGGPVTDLNVTCHAEPDGRGLRVEFEAAPDRYTAAELAAHQERFTTYLERFAAATADVPLGRTPVLTEAERHAVSAACEGEAGIAPRTFPELFEEQVRRTPAATAVLSPYGALDYATLNARANQLARRLVAHGAGPERRVAVAMPRGAGALTAVLAVLKSGAAYLPVDLEYPRERVSRMLADTAPLLLLTTADADDPTLAPTVPRLLLDSETAAAPRDGGSDTLAEAAARTGADLTAADPMGADLTDADRRAPLRPAHPAYVIYTSGSTGRPKGVVVPHTGIAALLRGQSELLPLGPGARVLHFSSPSFDASVWELCVSLLTGATAVVAPTERLLPGEPLAALVAELGVTCLLLAPSALAVLPEGALPAGTALVVGAEACAPELVGRWSGGRHMVNAYGPSESTVIATQTGPLAGRITPPMGAPLPGTGVRLLDDALRPVPPGVPGELYLSGAGLARGYLGRPGQTAERFTADPYGPPGTRMYRTGDLAQWTPQSGLTYLGRADHQVKVRGFRIELGEVESVLARAPGVARAAVVVREDRPGLRQLVGYVVPTATAGTAEGAALEPAELRALVAAELPHYMVPAFVVVLEELPRTPNGKLDQRALPAPRHVAGADHREPSTERERTLHAVFTEILGQERIGVDDSFFDLGGDSVVSVQLAARAQRAGLSVTPKDIFVHKTIAALAEIALDAAPQTAPRQTDVLLRLDADELDELEAQWETSL